MAIIKSRRRVVREYGRNNRIRIGGSGNIQFSGTSSGGGSSTVISPTWGNILGTLSDQSDLQSVLDNKANLSGSSSQDFNVANLDVYQNLNIRGEIYAIDAVVLPIDDAWIQLNSGNSEVNSGLKIYIGGGQESELYRNAVDDGWYIDSNKIALYDGNLNADTLDNYNSSDFTRKSENAIINGAWEFNNYVRINNSIWLDAPNYAPYLRFNRDDVNYTVADIFGGAGSHSEIVLRSFSSESLYKDLVWRNDGRLSVGVGWSPRGAIDVAGDSYINGSIYLNNTNTQILEGDNDTIRIATPNGYLNLGVKDSNYCYFNTDRTSYVFDKETIFGSNSIRSFNNDFIFKRLSDEKLRLTTDGSKFTGNIEGIQTFTSGFTGSGNYRLNPSDNGLSHLTLDRLTVRTRMDIYELVIQQLRASNGSLWISDAVKYDTVSYDDVTGLWLCTYDTDNGNRGSSFMVNDIVKAQIFTGRDVQVFKGRVFTQSTGVDEIIPLESTTPWDGMEAVRIDYYATDHLERRGAIYLTSSDNNSPYLDVTQGDGNGNYTPRIRLGRLNGVGSNTGYGIWGSSNGINESFVISTGDDLVDPYAKIAGFNFDNEYLWTGSTQLGNESLNIFHTETGDKGINIIKNSNTYLSLIMPSDGIEWGLYGYNDGENVFQLGAKNKIGGFYFNNEYLYTGDTPTADNSIFLSNTSFGRTIQVRKNIANYTLIHCSSDGNDWGITGYKDASLVFSFGSENIIGGFSFNDSKMFTDNIIFDSNNTLLEIITETDDSYAITSTATIRLSTNQTTPFGTDYYVAGEITPYWQIFGLPANNDWRNGIKISDSSTAKAFIGDNYVLIEANNIDIDGAINIKDTISFSGVSSFSANVDINAILTANEINVDTDINVIGDVYADSIDITTLVSAQSLEISGTVDIDGDLTANGTSLFIGTAQFNGEALLGQTRLTTYRIGESSPVSGSYSVDCNHFSSVSVYPSTSDVTLSFSNVSYGQIIVVTNRNDTDGAYVYFPYIGGTHGLNGGECCIIQFIEGSFNPSGGSGKFVLLGKYNNNW